MKKCKEHQLELVKEGECEIDNEHPFSEHGVYIAAQGYWDRLMTKYYDLYRCKICGHEEEKNVEKKLVLYKD